MSQPLEPTTSWLQTAPRESARAPEAGCAGPLQLLCRVTCKTCRPGLGTGILLD